MNRVLRRRVLIVASAASLGFTTGCGSERDWNPILTDEVELAGEWRDGTAVLRLTADGRYTCGEGPACDPLGPAGTWQRSGDFYIAFQPSDAPAVVEWRLSRREGRLQFAAGDTKGDPDLWQPKLTFEHGVPAS